MSEHDIKILICPSEHDIKILICPSPQEDVIAECKALYTQQVSHTNCTS